ncbi:hypothetical protein Bbelb_113620 [Branchiostoma belcheri]|nr:hypothetical protein Bbelb_113620 [Branchiostoma belcheri]
MGVPETESDTDDSDYHTYLDLGGFKYLDNDDHVYKTPYSGPDDEDYEQPESISCRYKTREFVRRMWHDGTASAACRLLLAVGVLAIIVAVICATQLVPGQKSPSPAYLNYRYGGVEPEGFVRPLNGQPNSPRARLPRSGNLHQRVKGSCGPENEFWLPGGVWLALSTFYGDSPRAQLPRSGNLDRRGKGSWLLKENG